jgi:CRISPR-associated endonuclease/helicase Cas3
MTEMPAFSDFYREVHGRNPFPWQARLAAQVLEDQRWPSNIGVPTGLGKTSTLDVAVWSLACSMARLGPRRSLPTRIWYVVNRRLLVDEAHDHAMRLSRLLLEASESPASALGRVANALYAGQAVRWEHGPLHVARLRGGAESGFRPPDPGTPSIVLSTVPMFGSRLLFRGYGTSSGMRSVDAALAGTDSLVLLDEAHTARPLVSLLEQRAELVPAEVEVLGGSRAAPQLVNLSASGVLNPDFLLGDDDLAHPVVRERLTASKPVSLSAASSKELVGCLAAEGVSVCAELLSVGVVPAVAVFVNTAARAPEIARQIERQVAVSELETLRRAEIRLLTGRFRSLDAATIRDELLSGEGTLRSGRAVDGLANPVFVVATQTLEVGADLDFDGLVTQSAGVRALTQRFGRLNRLGQRPHAQGRIVHETGKPLHAVYGDEPNAVWERLEQSIPIDSDTRSVDLGPSVVAQVLGEPADQPPVSPQLLPNHVREWAKTSPPKQLWEAPVEPFFSGEEDALRSVSVAWRSVLPTSTEPGSAHLLLRPPISATETVEVPIWEVRDLLGSGQSSSAFVIDDQGRLQSAVADDLNPGAIVVLPSGAGGYSSDRGWDPDVVGCVEDVSVHAAGEFVLTSRRVYELEPEFAKLGIGPDTVTALAAAADHYQSMWSGDVWVSRSAETDLELIGLPTTGVVRFRRVRGGPVVAQFERTSARSTAPRLQIEDELSTEVELDPSLAQLDRHLEVVGNTAGAIAKVLGLDPQVVAALELAGRLHDLGKADRRFQLLLGATSEVMAKSAGPGSGNPRLWPVGGRHEAISVQFVDKWLSENPAPLGVHLDLVRHLVMSHHGWGRPFLPPVAGALPISARISIEGADVEIVSDLAYADWEQPERFGRLNTEFGPWGLALLEAILRQADHVESSRSADVLKAMEVQ